jgi:hypothetical protein
MAGQGEGGDEGATPPDGKTAQHMQRRASNTDKAPRRPHLRVDVGAADGVVGRHRLARVGLGRWVVVRGASPLQSLSAARSSAHAMKAACRCWTLHQDCAPHDQHLRTLPSSRKLMGAAPNSAIPRPRPRASFTLLELGRGIEVGGGAARGAQTLMRAPYTAAVPPLLLAESVQAAGRRRT